MIVRILGEGQLDVAETELDSLNALDDAVEAAIDGGDDEAFMTAFAALLDRVREVGKQLAVDEIVPSDLVLPSGDATLVEVRDLLADDGLIPG